MQQMKCKCVQTQLDAIVTLIFVEVKCLQALIQPYASNSRKVLLITLQRPSRPHPTTPPTPPLHFIIANLIKPALTLQSIKVASPFDL